jgi:hypothetical protein
LETADSSVTIALIVEPTHISEMTKEDSTSVLEIITQSFFTEVGRDVPTRIRASFTNVHRYLAGIQKYCSLCCAVAVIVNGTLYVGSCGDLRIFHVRSDTFSKVSIVHTLPEISLVINPTQNPEDFLTHHYKPHGPINILNGRAEFFCDMRMQYTQEHIDETTVHQLTLLPDDIIILCSRAVFSDFIRLHDWEMFQQHFSHNKIPMQAIVDGYVSAIRSQPDQHWRDVQDITVLALKWSTR